MLARAPLAIEQRASIAASLVATVRMSPLNGILSFSRGRSGIDPNKSSLVCFNTQRVAAADRCRGTTITAILRKAPCVGVASAFAIAWFFTFTSVAAAQQSIQEATNRLYNAVELIENQLDRSLFEVDALVDRLRPDASALFRFVRDQVRYEPYYGALRGAHGTLVGRAGNALDRSLLLAEMLNEAGFEVRIAKGNLDHSTAVQLAERIFEPARPIPPALSGEPGLRRNVHAIFGINEEDAARRLSRLEEQVEQARRRLEVEVAAKADHLMATLEKAGVKLPDPVPVSALVPSAQEHFWVRYREPGSDWIDLDSAFADFEPGDTATNAHQEFAQDAIPDHLQHKLGVRFVIEVERDGKTIETVLLDETVATAAVSGVPIQAVNVPIPELDLSKVRGNVKEAAASINEFVPVLLVGDALVHGSFFDAAGRVFSSVPGTDAGNAERIGLTTESGMGGITSQLEDIFGLPPQTEQENAASDPSRLLAAFVEYRLESPESGEAEPYVRTYVRHLVRPIERDERSTEELKTLLIWSAELLPVTFKSSPDYLGYQQLKRLRLSQDVIGQLLSRAASGPEDAAVPGYNLGLPPTNLIALLTATSEEFRSMEGQESRGRTELMRRHGLVGWETRFASSGAHAPKQLQGYDVVASGAQFVSNSDSQAEFDLPPQLLLGVVQTEMEHALANMQATPVFEGLDRSTSQPVLSAAAALSAAREQGLNWIVIQPAPEAAALLRNITLPDHMKTDIVAAVQAGITAVVPVPPAAEENRPLVGWWQISLDGQTLIGIGMDGRGTATSEYSSTVRGATMAFNFNWGVLNCFALRQYMPERTRAELMAACIATAVVGAKFAGLDMYNNLGLAITNALISMSAYLTAAGTAEQHQQ